MIRTNNDLYQAVNELIRTLDNTGEQELASGLHDALGISSLPGEILGEIRLQLRRLSESLCSRIDIQAIVDDSVHYIDSVLAASPS